MKVLKLILCLWNSLHILGWNYSLKKKPRSISLHIWQEPITFLPYGALVDHYQHEVYEHPEMTPAERKACWRRLEKMYMPYKDYEGCDILEEGTWWYQQGHIFESPFYYIDYTLAQVCAQQFFIRMDKKDPTYWEDYKKLCRLGGTLSLQSL